jgi:predicted TIM-barrel fold metal-dependent hydrolase
MDLRSLPIVDQHAHNVLRPEAAAGRPYPAAFTEGYDPEVIERHARHTLFYRRSLREIGALLGCAPDEEAILARRQGLGLERLTELCFRTAGLEAVLLDDGFLRGEILPVAWHGRFVPAHRVLRLEALAQDLLTADEDFATFLERFRAALDPPPPGVVALKSIAAYRSGLAVEPVPRSMAEAQFAAWQRAAGAGPPRLADKVLVDFLLTQALELAARHRLPAQFHTGFGDPDLDLRLANPLHLRPLLEDPRYRAAPVVLLHASYPFVREAGYLASVYPHVYLDAGLAVPFLSVAGMRAVLGTLLELAPTTKLLYSSDAHLIPELYYLAATWGRALLGEALEQAVRDTDLTAREADAVAAAVLADNARSLYRLPRSPLTSPAPS